ncbi:MAG: HupE/UreJ family protein [Alphaproteobacteria bacterium]
MIRLFTLLAILIPGAALAHHPIGGMTPATIWQGFASGIGHPVIGFDHLAFIIGMAALALLTKAPRLMPLAFVGMTVVGTLVHLQAVTLPGAELVIAASVLLVGVLGLAGAKLPTLLAVAMFGFAGVFHGYAYGEAIVGAEASPLIAYLIGFAFVQTAIAWGLQLAAQSSSRMSEWIRAGAGIAVGVGAAFLVA